MTQVWSIDASETPERIALLNAQLSRDAELEQQARTTRSTTRMVSALSTFASMLALYDVLLLARGVH